MAMMQTGDAPSARIDLVTQARTVRPIRREDRSEAAPGSAARELDVEVTRLLRVRGGELAEPLLWQRPSHRREVETIVAQLAPIRSRIALLSSWDRESRWDSSVRLAYAIVWLRLAQRRAAEYGPRAARHGQTRLLVKARG
jgi:hypothetical protein